MATEELTAAQVVEWFKLIPDNSTYLSAGERQYATTGVARQVRPAEVLAYVQRLEQLVIRLAVKVADTV